MIFWYTVEDSCFFAGSKKGEKEGFDYSFTYEFWIHEDDKESFTQKIIDDKTDEILKYYLDTLEQDLTIKDTIECIMGTYTIPYTVKIQRSGTDLKKITENLVEELLEMDSIGAIDLDEWPTARSFTKLVMRDERFCFAGWWLDHIHDLEAVNLTSLDPLEQQVFAHHMSVKAVLNHKHPKAKALQLIINTYGTHELSPQLSKIKIQQEVHSNE